MAEQLFSPEYNYQRTLINYYQNRYCLPLKYHMRLAGNLFTDSGLDVQFAPALDYLRATLARDEFKTIMTSVGVTGKNYIPSLNDDQVQKVACIKFLRHLYMVHKQGGQAIWVVSTPNSYQRFVSSELWRKKHSDLLLSISIADTTERFSQQQKDILGHATNMARRWCNMAIIELTKADNTRGERLVRKWFTGSSGSTRRVTDYRGRLIRGIRKILQVLSSNKIIFTDMPSIRNSQDPNDKLGASAMAFVYSGNYERLPIIYIENGFFKPNAYLPQLEIAALTIIHEITHLELSTKDHKYDFQGLKPNTKLTPSAAIRNADSWAYFCCNAAQAIRQSTIARVLKG